MFVRIAIIKKMENNKCWPAKRNSCALLVGLQMSTYTVGNNTELLKFARSTSVMWPCYPINNGNLKDTSKRYLPSQIQGRTAYKNKDMESACLFTSLHRTKYHLCIQNEALLFTPSWVKLEDVLLHGVSIVWHWNFPPGGVGSSRASGSKWKVPCLRKKRNLEDSWHSSQQYKRN